MKKSSEIDSVSQLFLHGIAGLQRYRRHHNLEHAFAQDHHQGHHHFPCWRQSDIPELRRDFQAG